MRIEDTVLKPYFIELSSDNYNVIETTGKQDKKGNDIFKTHGHFSNVENALKKIVKLKVEVGIVYSLSQYLEALRLTKIQIENN